MNVKHLYQDAGCNNKDCDQFITSIILESSSSVTSIFAPCFLAFIFNTHISLPFFLFKWELPYKFFL
jgi:hypothetical protein